ncbi:MAG: thioredoxin [Muribaculaceae bacterium]|nr:thioredoxin [Muribaculaceae bacterium]
MSEFKEIIGGSKPTLVDFFATWCGPCKMQGPILEQLKNKVGDDANIIKIDVDRNPDLSAEYQIRSVPTIIIFKDGMPQWRASGLQQLEVLEDKIRIQMEPGK